MVRVKAAVARATVAAVKEAVATDKKREGEGTDEREAGGQQDFLGRGQGSFHRGFPVISKLAVPLSERLGWTMDQLSSPSSGSARMEL